MLKTIVPHVLELLKLTACGALGAFIVCSVEAVARSIRENRSFSRDLEAMEKRHAQQRDEMVKGFIVLLKSYAESNPEFETGSLEWWHGLLEFARQYVPSKNQIM